MPPHIVHFGNCPICQDGLRRVRTCGLRDYDLHGLIICDECEAIWTDPNLDSVYQYSYPEAPLCPICNQAIWSDNSRWSTVEDVCLLGWYTYCFIEPTDSEDT